MLYWIVKLTTRASPFGPSHQPKPLMKTLISPIIWYGATAPTPLGTLWIATSNTGLVALAFEEQTLRTRIKKHCDTEPYYEPSSIAHIAQQLEEFLSGQRTSFTVNIDWSWMSTFQQKTLKTVFMVPYGTTISYSALAQTIGLIRGARAVARANATNPLPLIIPCHRIIGKQGALCGYSAHKGIATKQWLLELEQQVRSHKNLV